jgi:two-component system NtrC family sensor kinase
MKNEELERRHARSRPTGLTFVRQYLYQLLEHANALIVAADRSGRIQLFNGLFSQLIGIRGEEMLGRELTFLAPEGERLPLAEAMAASLRGEAANFETCVSCSNGRQARVSLASSPIFSTKGQIDGFIAIGQDLTAVKELERRVIHAEKLASLGQFAASVVHEINNPLTAVVSLAESLLTRTLTMGSGSSNQEKLRKILDGCERILRFTRQLVSYARPAQEKSEALELDALLDNAVSYCDHILSHHGIRLERDYGEMPNILGVKGHLVQVFVNLITNACQAMQPGGVIHISTRCEGAYGMVRIQDHGLGIDDEDLERVFEPFFTTKAAGQGTGLGLSIAQGIVESHGGTIGAESALGEGTTFVIRLPFGPASTTYEGVVSDTEAHFPARC